MLGHVVFDSISMALARRNGTNLCISICMPLRRTDTGANGSQAGEIIGNGGSLSSTAGF